MTGDTRPVEQMSSREILVGPFTAALNRAASDEIELAVALKGIDKAEEAIERWVNGVMQDGDVATIAAFPGTYAVVNEIVNYTPSSPPRLARKA